MTPIDRRTFLAAALGVAAAPCCTMPGEAAQAAPQGNPRWIDLHHHFAPPAWVADVRGRPLLQPANTRWTPEQSIEDMDRGGVAAAVVSITNPGLWFGDPAQSRPRPAHRAPCGRGTAGSENGRNRGGREPILIGPTGGSGAESSLDGGRVRCSLPPSSEEQL